MTDFLSCQYKQLFWKTYMKQNSMFQLPHNLFMHIFLSKYLPSAKQEYQLFFCFKNRDLLLSIWEGIREYG